MSRNTILALSASPRSSTPTATCWYTSLRSNALQTYLPTLVYTLTIHCWASTSACYSSHLFIAAHALYIGVHNSNYKFLVSFGTTIGHLWDIYGLSVAVLGRSQVGFRLRDLKECDGTHSERSARRVPTLRNQRKHRRN